MAAERHLGLAVEASWGTAETTMDLWLEILSEGIQLEPAYQELKTIRTRSTRIMALLRDVVRGPASVLVNYQDIAHLFAYLLGTVETSGSGPYTHTSPHTSNGMDERPGLTIEVQRDEGGDGDTWRYPGNVLTALSLAVSLEAAMTAELGVVGKGEATGSADTPSYPDLDIVIPSHVGVSFDGTGLDARTFNLAANYPVDEPGKLGSTDLAKKPDDSDTLTVTGDTEIYFDSMTQYNKFSGHSDVDVQLSATDGTHSLTVNLDVCKLTAGTPHVDGRNRLVCPFSFQATYDATALGNLQAITVNDVATISL